MKKSRSFSAEEVVDKFLSEQKNRTGNLSLFLNRAVKNTKEFKKSIKKQPEY